MKIALISDIQGNATALRIVFEQITMQQVDIIYCLGDTVTGAQPRDVLHLLQEHDCITIMGNMDRAVLAPQPTPAPDDEAARNYAEIDAWCAAQLSGADRAYLHDFRPFVNVELGTQRLLCCHGSPESDEAVLDHTTPETQLLPLFTAHQADFLAVGHLHEPLLRTLSTNHILLNPGSVGLPDPLPQTGKRPLLARYALITTANDQTSISFHRIAYDPVRFSRELLASGMPHAAWYLAQWGV